MSQSIPIIVSELNIKHRKWTTNWHSLHVPTETDEPYRFIESNHSSNFSLWHQEDIARRTDLGAQAICNAKRAIDHFNQQRNDCMESIDNYILGLINSYGRKSSALSLHSETPGMIIDRLSIMALKEYHMHEEATRSNAPIGHQQKCTEKLIILQEQQHDLSDCLCQLLEDLANGNKRFKVYRQLKMYNDPSLNPQLYSPSVI